MKKMKKAIAAIMLMTAVIMTACTPENDPNNNGNDNGGGNNGGDNGGGGDTIVNCGGIGTFAGHEYVDLCLPSGTLWATCNVGADTPEGCGDYFAWGEVWTKSHYHWENYRYCNGFGTAFTKYCPQSEYGNEGYTDTLTRLKREDDYALLNWANGWRMPTRDQWRELVLNTTSTWTNQKDVYGLLFTAENGYSLFLPAAGDFVSYGPADNQNIQGYYWSNTLSPYAFNAWSFVFTSTIAIPREDNRCHGYTIRPVCKIPQ